MDKTFKCILVVFMIWVTVVCCTGIISAYNIEQNIKQINLAQDEATLQYLIKLDPNMNGSERYSLIQNECNNVMNNETFYNKIRLIPHATKLEYINEEINKCEHELMLIH